MTARLSSFPGKHIISKILWKYFLFYSGPLLAQGGWLLYVCYNYKKIYPHLLQMIFFSVVTLSFLIIFSFLFTNVNGRNGFMFTVYLVFVFPGLIFCSW